MIAMITVTLATLLVKSMNILLFFIFRKLHLTSA